MRRPATIYRAIYTRRMATHMPERNYGCGCYSRISYGRAMNLSLQSTLFVIASTQLLAFFKNPNHFSTSQNNPEGALRALIIICYASLFFNASAAISSFILMDKLGELPFRAASKRQSILPTGGTITGNSEDLLKRYGVGKLWTFLVWHCQSINLMRFYCLIIIS